MTDTPERDPTRTEDVEERARGALQELEKFASRSWSPEEQPYTPDELGNMIRERLGDLRSRLETCRADLRAMSDDYDAVHSSMEADRRRSEELEEAVRDLLAVRGRVGAGTEREFTEVLDRLRSALDRREDEGGGGVTYEGVDDDGCTCTTYPHPRKGPTARIHKPDCPVHADEPEGERTCCGAPPSEECHDCPAPTDEHVSGEGVGEYEAEFWASACEEAASLDGADGTMLEHVLRAMAERIRKWRLDFADATHADARSDE